MISKCAVLVSSCDKYEDAWMPFFHFFKKYWKDCPFPVYLNTETKNYTDSQINISVINSPTKTESWSARLKNALCHIKSEYIVFLLEDFFFLSPVDNAEIERCEKIMDSDKRISVIDFEYTPHIPSKETEYQGYVERSKNGMYFLNCQAALWRRKDLIRFINDHENPWQFELFGSERAKLYNKRFLLLKYNKAPFDYIVNWDTGYGLHGGKWLKSNIDLFKGENLLVDFHRMGFYEGNNVITNCLPPAKSLRWRVMYALYGGFDEPRVELKDQFFILFKHPRTFIRAFKKRMRFITSK